VASALVIVPRPQLVGDGHRGGAADAKASCCLSVGSEISALVG
jgi:hypothetical protein